MCLVIPGKIVEFLRDDPHYAIVDVSGVRRKVNIDILKKDGVNPGDWVMVHAGFAMSKISKEQVEEQLRVFRMFRESDEAVLDMLKGKKI